MAECECSQLHTPRRVVLTGGPGAGKTAANAGQMSSIAHPSSMRLSQQSGANLHTASIPL